MQRHECVWAEVAAGLEGSVASADVLIADKEVEAEAEPEEGKFEDIEGEGVGGLFAASV